MPLLKLDNLLLADRYQIQHRLSQGSYAEICTAYDQQEQRIVIIKALNPALRGTPDALLEEKLRANFAQEARVLKTLSHPNIVQMLDQGEAFDDSRNGFAYLVLEYLAGGTLQAHCRHAPLTLVQVQTYFRPVTAALEMAHAHGIIHRDLTPANLLLSADKSTVKVSDFGVAKVLVRSNNPAVTRVGTDLYAPPEHHPNQEESFEPLTPAADVYSLAKTIYYVLTGSAPQEFRHQPIDRLPATLAAQPEGQPLLTVLQRATATRVQDRYASVAEFWQNFGAVEARHDNGHVHQKVPARNRIVIEFAAAKDKPEPDLPAPLKSSEFQFITLDAAGRVEARRQARARVFAEELGQGETLELMEIPAGTFLMGSPTSEAERKEAEGPQHSVRVPAFFCGKYPITQAQWRVVAQWPPVNCALPLAPSVYKGAQHPVENISWYDAVEFCARLSQHTKRHYRLPTEAEWEYACRAGTTTPFHCGATITPAFACYDGTLPYAAAPKGKERLQTTPVGSFKLCNAFGLSDLHGNVWEWCADAWRANYQSAPVDARAWEDADKAAPRVIRGGSWFNAARLCRSAYRFFAAPDSRSHERGFRVVLMCK